MKKDYYNLVKNDDWEKVDASQHSREMPVGERC